MESELVGTGKTFGTKEEKQFPFLPLIELTCLSVLFSMVNCGMSSLAFAVDFSHWINHLGWEEVLKNRSELQPTKTEEIFQTGRRYLTWYSMLQMYPELMKRGSNFSKTIFPPV